MSDTITFLASFPPIQSAIKIGADGMRLQLDVPESEMAEAVGLLALRQQVLRVTIEPEKQRQTGEQRTISEGPKRKSQWKTTEEPGAN